MYVYKARTSVESKRVCRLLKPNSSKVSFCKNEVFIPLYVGFKCYVFKNP